MTLQEQLEIIQAAIDGKIIQHEASNDSWRDKDMIVPFNFQNFTYRIKPEEKKDDIVKTEIDWVDAFELISPNGNRISASSAVCTKSGGYRLLSFKFKSEAAIDQASFPIHPRWSSKNGNYAYEKATHAIWEKIK